MLRHRRGSSAPSCKTGARAPSWPHVRRARTPKPRHVRGFRASQVRHRPDAPASLVQRCGSTTASGGTMGFINNAKGETAAKAAAAAYSAGRQVFAFKIIEANTNSRSTGPMIGVAEQIEGIEAQGWFLANMAGAEGKALGGERTALLCLFRRRQ